MIVNDCQVFSLLHSQPAVSVPPRLFGHILLQSENIELLIIACIAQQSVFLIEVR